MLILMMLLMPPAARHFLSATVQRLFCLMLLTLSRLIAYAIFTLLHYFFMPDIFFLLLRLLLPCFEIDFDYDADAADYCSYSFDALFRCRPPMFSSFSSLHFLLHFRGAFDYLRSVRQCTRFHAAMLLFLYFDAFAAFRLLSFFALRCCCRLRRH